MNLKTTIVTALLLLAMVSGTVAQEKYEYAVVQLFCSGNIDLTVSVNGEKYEETMRIDRATLGSKYNGYDVSPVLKKVNEMQDKGWELYDQTVFSQVSPVYVFYMRKKKQ